jgi:hypothetical protein
MGHATPGCRAARSALLALWLCGMASAAGAQVYQGRVAAGCGAFDVQREFTVGATAAVAAGAVALVSIAARADVLSDVTVVDPGASDYASIGAVRPRAKRLAVIQFSSRIAGAIASTSAWRVASRNADSGVPVCVAVDVFADLVPGQGGLHARGAARADGSVLGLAADNGSDGTPELLFGSFALDGDPGSVAAAAPAVSLPPVCASGGLCLATGYATGVASGPLDLTLNAGAVVPWAGALVVIDRDGMFRDGFE